MSRTTTCSPCSDPAACLVLHERDGAARSRRRQLDDAEVLTGAVVHVEVEAGGVGVERLRPVDVSHRDHHRLESPVHPSHPSCPSRSAPSFSRGGRTPRRPRPRPRPATSSVPGLHLGRDAEALLVGRHQGPVGRQVEPGVGEGVVVPAGPGRVASGQVGLERRAERAASAGAPSRRRAARSRPRGSATRSL